MSLSGHEPPAATTPAAVWTENTLAALDHAAVDPASPLSGATAQTSGFAQAAIPDENADPRATFGGGLASSPNVPKPGTTIDPNTGKPHVAGLTRAELEHIKAAKAAEATQSTAPSAGLGGGLASSPNVPLPGTSIDPATGKPHTAGLTREELAQIKAKGAELLDPTPHTVVARRSSVSDERARRLSDLSGREQAARQLAGVGAGVPEDPELSGGEQAARQLAAKSIDGQVPVIQSTSAPITPGHELPAVKPLAPSGTGQYPTTSLYEDVGEALQKVGNVAYSVIPAPIKEALSAHTSPNLSAQGSPNATTGRRGSAAVLFEKAKQEATKVVAHVEETFATGGRRESLPKSSARRASGTIGSDGSVLQQVKGLFGTIVNGPLNEPVIAEKPYFSHLGSTAVAPATSLPSNEPAGALPGQHSSGVGALPGAATETGVAVLPLEKENQSKLPGEVGVVPDPSVSASPSAFISAPATTVSQSTSSPSSMVNSGSYGGLAAPLPQTTLGTGADKGATDVGLGSGALAGVGALTAGAGAAAAAAHSSAGGDLLSPSSGTAQETRHSGERSTSSASVTAIRGGHEGDHPVLDGIGEKPSSSPLATAAPATAAATLGQRSTTPGTGPAHTTSLTPGAETNGVGHPSTRTLEGATREPGTYPVVDHSAAHSSVDGAANHNVVDSAPMASAVAPSNGHADHSETATASAPGAATHGTANGTATTPAPTATTADLANKPFPDTTDEKLQPTVALLGGATGLGHKDNLPVSNHSGEPVAMAKTPSPGSSASKTEIPSTLSGQGSGHKRSDSTASTKRGLFSKIKDKIKHHDK